METQLENAAEEIKRLQRCISDLVSVLTLPALWSGGEPSRVVHTLLDTLLRMLLLDLVYVRLKDAAGKTSLEMVRLAQSAKPAPPQQEISTLLDRWLQLDPLKRPARVQNPVGDGDLSIVALPLGLQGEIGVVVAGSQRADFPQQTESLLLNVAVNQASLGLQEARLLSEQKRVASELDLRVAQRTRELAETNEELQLQVGLLQHLPVSTWTLKPDGTPDFVNRVWLEFSGQTLDFVRSHPEAWMTAVHPEDRETASRVFWEGVRSGQGFAFETRSLRARDGTYRWHLQQAVVLRDAEGKVLKFVGTTTDIDDQKRAEEALRASEANLRRVIDTIPTLSWCNLADGPNEFLSKSWHEYTGLSPEEAHGWGWAVAFHPDDLPPLMKRWQELLVSGEPGEIEARLRRHDGVYRWFLIRVAPFRDESGAILRWYGTSTDIHDRKRAEDELRARELTARSLLDNMPGFLARLSPDGVPEIFNRRFLDYLGRTLAEISEWRSSDTVHPDDLAHTVDVFGRAIASGQPMNFQYRLRRFDGVYRWFQARLVPVRDVEGRILHWNALVTDIEDRKQAEEALRASESNLRQIVDSIPGLVCTMNATGEIEQLNRPLLEYFGKTPEELKDWRMTDAIHPNDLPEVVKAYKHSVTTGSPYEIEHRCRRADGVYRWFQVRALAVRDADNRITGWYVLLTDIDDRKRAEDELRHKEALLAEVQHVSLTGGFSWHVDTDVVTFSEEAYRIFEFEKGAPVTLAQIADRVHPEDIPLLSEKLAGTRSGGDYDYEMRLRMPDGSIKYLHTISHGIRDREGRLERIGAIQDVTRRRVSEEALGRARSELAQVSRFTTLGVLTASIAHEVNQPLSGIVTNASTCLRMLAADPPQVEGAKETARRTIRDGNRASEVIARLRALFRKTDTATESVNLNEAALEVIALSSTELQKNRVVLRPELADDLPLVRGDRVQLQQVILNLLRNGSDAMSAVEDRPRQLLIRTERDEGDGVRLTVQDAGVGFDPQAADRLFDAFFTTKGEGMGIGLSVSRSIIESHHGRLWATLNDGPGAAFSFSIPRAPEGLAGTGDIRSFQARAVTDEDAA
jgi:PAS domain S-box-containing protein